MPQAAVAAGATIVTTAWVEKSVEAGRPQPYAGYMPSPLQGLRVCVSGFVGKVMG